MKKLLCCLLCLMPFIASAQEEDGIQAKYKDGKIFYEEVVEVEGTPKDDLYGRVKRAFAELFGGAKVIKTEDRENGYLLANAGMNYNNGSSEHYASFMVTFEIKDNKYRMRTYDIEAVDVYSEEFKRTFREANGTEMPISEVNLNGTYESLYIRNAKFLRKFQIKTLKAFDDHMMGFINAFEDKVFEYGDDDF